MSLRTHRHWNRATRLCVLIAGSTLSAADASRVPTALPGPAEGPAAARSAPASRYSPRFRSPWNREPLAWITNPHPPLGKFGAGRGGGPSKTHRISSCRSGH
jgi:hypothetical protein